ncbi:hypothetical protein [Ferrimonas marina]|uniref:DUF4148 domain-containing protein n=1 Tax=Ferrimonas marina TaxID=299255 RepID=A0A1M5YSV7_9GAMM|nr:hypothetical protein [Ferrimonas marina]SHI15085.1 hypothetical protein SAMN02745129_4391 [Ferrimonas marina]
MTALKTLVSVSVVALSLTGTAQAGQTISLNEAIDRSLQQGFAQVSQTIAEEARQDALASAQQVFGRVTVTDYPVLAKQSKEAKLQDQHQALRQQRGE